MFQRKSSLRLKRPARESFQSAVGATRLYGVEAERQARAVRSGERGGRWLGTNILGGALDLRTRDVASAEFRRCKPPG